MQLSYGSYSWADNACRVTNSAEYMRNEAERPYQIRKSVQVAGYLDGSSNAAVNAAVISMENALAVPYRDLVLALTAGGQSAVSLLNSGSIDGVKLTGPVRYPDGTGADYVTYRKFEFEMGACYPLAGTNNLLISWQESLTYGGGNPLFIVKNAINGPPQRQMVFPQTAFTVTQSGSAVGYQKYPLAPPPTFPAALKQSGNIVRRSPKRQGTKYVEWPISWTYEFESVTPLIGLPNLWKGL